MLNIPLSLRLTTGLVVLMICSLLFTEALGFHLEYLAGMITVVTALGIAIGLFIITRSHRQIDLVAIAPALLRSTLDALAEGVVLIDNKERIIIANSAFADITGITPQKLKGASLSGFGLKQANAFEQEAPWMTCIREGIRLTEHMYLVDQHGEKKLYVVDCAPARDSRGRDSGVMLSFDDVTRREAKNDQLEDMLVMLKKSRDEIRHQNEVLQELATRDSLTNCLNRRAFFDKYETVFRAAQRGSHPLACIITDIDLFKSINDRYGHTQGDNIIFTVAETLHRSLRSTDTVCRYGGEEFCIILPGIELSQAIEMSERARGNIEQLDFTDEPGSKRIAITSSFGVAAIEHQPESLSQLIDRADKALYRSKHTGRNRVTAWLPEKFNHEDPAASIPGKPAQVTETRAAQALPPGDDVRQNLDSLTGLPTLQEFHSSIVSAVDSCKITQQLASIMMLDLATFNRINSTLGYDVGDVLL